MSNTNAKYQTQLNRETVVGVFHSHTEAQHAIRELKAAGFTDDQIGVTSRDHDGVHSKALETETTGNHAKEGAIAGVAGGLGVGALWGIGIAAGLLPAIGPFIAGGTLAAIAASAAGGAAAAGLAGALIGAGIPEEEAAYYDSQFQSGRTLVTVHAGKGRAAEAMRILDDSNAYDYDRRETGYAKDETSQRANLAGEMVARKEILSVDKHERTAGGATIRKEVTTDVEQVNVPLRKEVLVVERTAADGAAAGPITGTETQEERIVLKEEVADVDKHTVAKEKVSVGKEVRTENRNVEREVREEHIRVDRDQTTTRN